jgi:hypothetical protein
MSEADEIVELFVPARERSCVARALLQAAEQLGLPAGVVQSTSYGYWVPKRVADAVDVDLARQAAAAAGAAGEPVPGGQAYAAHPPGGRVRYERDAGPADQDDDQADEQGDVELPEPVRNRRRGGRK